MKLQGGKGRGLGGPAWGRGHRGGFDQFEAGPWLRASRLLLPSLLLLVAESAPTHGYELAGKLNELGLSGSEVDAGAIYRGLRKLEQGGFIVSEWDTSSGGAARRVYELTDEGRLLLKSYREVLSQRVKALQQLLERLARVLEKEQDSPGT